MRTTKSRFWPRLGAALLGPLFYVLSRGWGPVLPGSLRWMTGGDRFPALVGWLDFYREPWQFPIGKFSAQFTPGGGYLGYTDSIPWFSSLMKLLLGRGAEHGRALVQFFGVYELLSYALFAYFAYRLLELFELKWRDCLLGTLLLLFSPVLIQRSRHIALCSQWEILAAFFLYFRALAGKPVSRVALAWAWAALIFVSASTHPYLGVMVTAIGCAAALGSLQAIGIAAMDLGVMAFTFWLFGYFAVKSAPQYGFEVFTSDLLALFNPMGLSRFFPAIRMSSSEAEGFAYLGLGVLALWIFLGIEHWRKGRMPLGENALLSKRGPLLGIALAMAFYSLSSHVSIAGHTIFTMEWLYHSIAAVTNAFRACGRFVWVLYYYLYVMIILAIATPIARQGRRRRSARVATALLAGALVLQWLDLGPALARAREPMGDIPAELSPARWTGLWSAHGTPVRHVEFVPAGFPDIRSCDTGFFDPDRYLPMALSLVERGITSNAGYRAHFNPFDLKSECQAAARAFISSGWDPSTIYIFPPGTRPKSRRFKGDCQPRNGVVLCVGI